MLKKAKSLEAEQMIQSVLSAHERLLWSGVPPQRFHLRKGHVFLLVLGLIWAGCVVFAFVNAVQATHVPVFIQIWWLPLVLIGACCFCSPFIADKYRRSHTWYGVTDQRVVLLSQRVFSRIKSLPLRGLNDVGLSERADGGGRIELGRSIWWFDAPWLDLDTSAREVHELILEAQRRELVTAVSAPSAFTGSSDSDPQPA